MIKNKILLLLINISNIFSVKHDTIVYHNTFQRNASNINTRNINTRNINKNLAIQFVKSPAKNNKNNKERRSFRNSSRKKNEQILYFHTVSRIKSNRSVFLFTFF